MSEKETNEMRERLVRIETKMVGIEKQLEELNQHVFPTFVKLARYIPIERVVLGMVGVVLIFVLQFALEKFFQ